MKIQLSSGETISWESAADMVEKERAESAHRYPLRVRTLEEVADLLNVSFELRRLKGKKHLWQAKLEKLCLYGNKTTAMKYIICRADNPNDAMDLLCKKISHKTVVGPKLDGKHKVVALGLVQRKPLYLRYSGSEKK